MIANREKSTSVPQPSIEVDLFSHNLRIRERGQGRSTLLVASKKQYLRAFLKFKHIVLNSALDHCELD